MLLAVIVLTAVIAVVFRRRLTRNYRTELDASIGAPDGRWRGAPGPP
jgi:hypothetical protein